jgi:hypothetical protein
MKALVSFGNNVNQKNTKEEEERRKKESGIYTWRKINELIDVGIVEGCLDCVSIICNSISCKQINY